MTPLTAVTTSPRSGRTDSDLVRACIAGDEEAWGELIDRYDRLIFSIPLRQGLSRDEAADIFQAVCVELISQLPNLRDPEALPAWLMRTTSRKVSRYRERNRRYVPDSDDSFDSTPDAAELPDSALEICERAQALRDGVEALPERCQAMVRMLFFETPARPYREVAAALGVATGSIGFLRGRCLDRLRAMLDEVKRWP